MIGILVVTHGRTAEDLIATAAQMLGGRPPAVATLGIDADEEIESALARGRALIREVDDGSGVLVLADMFGATPSNIAARLLVNGRVEGVSGLSLPMLIRALGARSGTLAAAVERAMSGGVDGIVHMNRDCCRDGTR